MLDPYRLRNDLASISQALARRGFALDTTVLAQLEARRKSAQTATEELQAERNRRSKSIGEAKSRGEDIEPLRAEVARLGEDLKTRQSELEAVQEELESFALGLPNLPNQDIPDGKGEDDNLEIRRWGEIRDFRPASPCRRRSRRRTNSARG